MGKYLDSRLYITFKAVFADHADLITSLLNALLPLDKDKYVTEVEYLPVELLPIQFEKKNCPMKSKGYPIENIAEIVGLSVEEIEKL